MDGQTAIEPVFLNLEYIFFLFYRVFGRFFSYLFSAEFVEHLKVALTLVAILLITAIIYCLIRLWEIEREEKKKKEKISPRASTLAPNEALPRGNARWEAIRARGFSEDQGAWRLAIIEADIYLDAILLDRGYAGETLSDRLKQLSPEKLKSVQLAWEAHKVRNRIAHEGAAFVLTLPEARAALRNFETVFRELGVIE